MFAHTDRLGVPEGVRIVEIYNGGSRENEDQIAIDNASRLGYQGIGGSDSHIVSAAEASAGLSLPALENIVSHIGRCATRFPGTINNEQELVAALKSGDFEAVNLKRASVASE